MKSRTLENLKRYAIVTIYYIYRVCIVHKKKLIGTLKLKVIAERSKLGRRKRGTSFGRLLLCSSLRQILTRTWTCTWSWSLRNFRRVLNPAKEQSVWFLSFVGTYTIKLQPAESNLTFCTVAGNYFCYSLANNFVTRPTPKCARIDC